ncbi:MAG: NlpC/P60 family protein, partial [Deltaproteobacteria bacterium]
MTRRTLSFATLAAATLAACGQGFVPPAETQAVELGVDQQALSRYTVRSCDEAGVNAIAPASAHEFLSRAYDWVNRGVPYCQCVSGQGGPYRTDCSGFVSYVWGLPPPGQTTWFFAGGSSDNGTSKQISWSELTPGDALNNGPDHIMLFAGWVDSNDICTIEEHNTGYPAQFMVHSLDENWSEPVRDFTPIRKTGYEPTSVTPAAPLVVYQPTGNGSITATNWADGHAEVFARTEHGRVVHAWTDGETDR